MCSWPMYRNLLKTFTTLSGATHPLALCSVHPMQRAAFTFRILSVSVSLQRTRCTMFSDSCRMCSEEMRSEAWLSTNSRHVTIIGLAELNNRNFSQLSQNATHTLHRQTARKTLKTCFLQLLHLNTISLNPSITYCRGAHGICSLNTISLNPSITYCRGTHVTRN